MRAVHGLFEVVPGVYQVRGLALANVTFIEGATGAATLLFDVLGRFDVAFPIVAPRRPR